MTAFNQNFVEAINERGRIRPGEFDPGKLFSVLGERRRFGETVVLINKIRAFISKRAVSDIFTHHYFIHSASLNDGLAAATAIYYAIAEKYNYTIGDDIIDRTDGRNSIVPFGGMTDEIDEHSAFIPDDDNPSIFMYHRTDNYNIVSHDICGVKISFVIYSDDVANDMSDLFMVFGSAPEENKKSGGAVSARQIAMDLHYTYINIPADSSAELAGFINEFFNRQGFLTDGVKKEIKLLAEHSCVKDEYSAIAAAKNVLNRHISYLNELPELMPHDFSEYLRKYAPAGRRKRNRSVIGEKDKLVGLEKEKRELNSAINGLILDAERQKAGLGGSPMGCNMVFAGSPGTAKTTLARIFAKSLAENNIIPSEENFKECRKSDIIGKFVGHTAAMVDGLFEDMHKKGGGVIFFDEIYSLTEDNSTCYDKEAINCITQNIENYRSSVYCIFAGYKNKMNGFIESNPGLSSRISATILFDDYSGETLRKIFDSMVSSEEYVISGDYSEYLGEFFEKLRRLRGESFGNGREARNLLEGAKRLMASRVIPAKARSKSALSTIKAEKIKAAADTILASVIKEERMNPIGF